MDEALARAKLSAKMLLQVHDELVFEVPDSEVAATIEVVRKVMVEAPHPRDALVPRPRKTGTRRIEHDPRIATPSASLSRVKTEFDPLPELQPQRGSTLPAD
jgi:hypothetical protein